MAIASLLLAAAFTLCDAGPRTACVVDGDTFWLNGQKVRIADINAPEVSQPACRAEAKLGAAAALRLVQLLNQGPIELSAGPRNRDRYGRLLRTVRRDGRSLGGKLVAEGLAERWKGHRKSWCTA